MHYNISVANMFRALSKNVQGRGLPKSTIKFSLRSNISQTPVSSSPSNQPELPVVSQFDNVQKTNVNSNPCDDIWRIDPKPDITQIISDLDGISEKSELSVDAVQPLSTIDNDCKPEQESSLLSQVQKNDTNPEPEPHAVPKINKFDQVTKLFRKQSLPTDIIDDNSIFITPIGNKYVVFILKNDQWLIKKSTHPTSKIIQHADLVSHDSYIVKEIIGFFDKNTKETLFEYAFASIGISFFIGYIWLAMTLPSIHPSLGLISFFMIGKLIYEIYQFILRST